MARLQILELPAGAGDDRPPFVLVVDETVPQRVALGPDTPFRDYWQDLAQQIGARGVIVTPETVDIPAHEPLPSPTGARVYLGEMEVSSISSTDSTDRAAETESRLKALAGEYAALQEQLNEARMWARHGYEIGQRHCGWSDHGVAPDWLTEGWPNHFDSCEHLKRAAELEKAEDIRKRVAKGRKAALLDALGMDHTRDWDDIRNAAAGLRKQRDSQAGAIERVRQLHQSVDYRGTVICRECSAYSGQSTDNAPVDHDKCDTLRVLTVDSADEPTAKP